MLKELLEKVDWEGVNKVSRIRSDVFEANDEESLTKVLEFGMASILIRLNEVFGRGGNHCNVQRAISEP